MFDSAGDAPGEDLCMLGSARELAAMPAQAIGKIRTTTGSVTVTRTGGVVVQGNVGDLVYQGDVIETAADGAVVIIFNDGTAFNLASDARMVLDEFVCDPEGHRIRLGLVSRAGCSISLPAKSRRPAA